MAKLITNLPLPLIKDLDYYKDGDYVDLSDGSRRLREYPYGDGIMEYTKNANIKKFTIKPAVNNLLTADQVYKYSSCNLKSSADGLVFEKYGNGFRYDFNYLKDDSQEDVILLDLDITNTGHKLEAGKTYCLSLYVSNGVNYEASNFPNGVNISYGGNLNEEGNIVRYTISANRVPNTINAYGPQYIKFTASEDCYHIYIIPTDVTIKQNSSFTLWILGLTEGEDPSFILDNNIGFSPVISSSNSNSYITASTGYYGTKNHPYLRNLVGIDGMNIIRSVSDKLNEYQDIFKLKWR